MIDKNKEMHVSVMLANEKLNFIGTAGKNDPVAIDYIAPLGDDAGYTSLELLLISLTSCLGSAVLTFLRKMQKTIVACEIGTLGTRKEEHPTGFKTISMDIHIVSPDITEPEMEKVIKFVQAAYCPVWSMLEGNVELEVHYKISTETY